MSGSQGALVPTNTPVPAPGGAPAQPATTLPPPGVADDNQGSSQVAIHADDPDEAALSAARNEAAQEGGQQQQQSAAQPTQVAQQPARTQQPPQQRPAARQQQPQAVMVPKGRLDEALRRAAAAEADATYWKGAAEARAALLAQGQPAPGQQPAASQQQPAQQPATAAMQLPQARIEAHELTIRTAAKQFDEGQITMEQFVEIQQREQNAIREIAAQSLLATVAQPQASPAVGIADSEIMQRHLADMEQRHPWVNVLSQQELRWLEGVVRNEQAALGSPIGRGPVETIRLRQGIAELSDTYGPRWYPDRAAQVEGSRVSASPNPPVPQPTRQAQPPAGQQPAPSPSPQAAIAQQRLADAARHPPNINQAGVAGNSVDLITEANIEQMTSDEIEALPAAVRARILSG